MDIAVDATNVYFTTGDKVMKVPIDGGSVQTIFDGRSRNVTAGAIAVDAANVYWTRNGAECWWDPPGRLMKMPLAGGPPTVLASGWQNPITRNIGLDATSVYLGATKVSIAGGVQTPLTMTTTYALAVTGSGVYWIGQSGVETAATCQNGTCRCPGTQVDCYGWCTDTAVDPANCGDCSVVCPSATCVSGSCL